MNRADLLSALDDANVRAFLRVIREGESSQENDAYTIVYGGSHFDAPPWEHPRKPIQAGGLTSTASGAYQFLARTWDALVEAYGFEDFSPGNQDQGAVALIAGRKALEDVKLGRLEIALSKCCKEWASLPNPATGKSYYRQGGLKLSECRLVFESWGGTVQDKPKEAPMAPIILPLIQAAASLIPQLAAQFGSGTEVSNRNVAAAKIIGDKIVEATNAPNLQAAVERMQEDTDALRAAKEAVAQVYPQLFEVGGGAQEARKAASDPAQIDWWKNPAVIVAFAVLPLIYMVVMSVVFGIGNQSWSDDVKTLTVTALLSGALGSITGFFLGSSLGSQRKTAMISGRE